MNKKISILTMIVLLSAINVDGKAKGTPSKGRMSRFKERGKRALQPFSRVGRAAKGSVKEKWGAAKRKFVKKEAPKAERMPVSRRPSVLISRPVSQPAPDPMKLTAPPPSLSVPGMAAPSPHPSISASTPSVTPARPAEKPASTIQAIKQERLQREQQRKEAEEKLSPKEREYRELLRREEAKPASKERVRPQLPSEVPLKPLPS